MCDAGGGNGWLLLPGEEPTALKAWYLEHLGVGGGVGTDANGRSNEWVWFHEGGPMVFSPFKADSDYFAADKQTMINLRMGGSPRAARPAARRRDRDHAGADGLHRPVRPRPRPRGQRDRALGARHGLKHAGRQCSFPKATPCGSSRSRSSRGAWRSGTRASPPSRRPSRSSRWRAHARRRRSPPGTGPSRPSTVSCSAASARRLRSATSGARGPRRPRAAPTPMHAESMRTSASCRSRPPHQPRRIGPPGCRPAGRAARTGWPPSTPPGC